MHTFIQLRPILKSKLKRFICDDAFTKGDYPMEQIYEPYPYTLQKIANMWAKNFI